jgi:hypothetical protein
MLSVRSENEGIHESLGSYDLTKVTDADLDRLEAILAPVAVL